jgi:hypothetical protein
MKISPRTISCTLLTALLACTSASATDSAVPGLDSADGLARERAPSQGNTLWTARSGGYQPLSGYGLDRHFDADNLGATLVLQPDGSLGLFSSMTAQNSSLAGTTSVPWCAESSGLLRIGSLGQECLMQGTLQFELPGQIASAQSGVNFAGQNWDVTLSYGLSWLMDKLDIGASPASLLPAIGAHSAALPLNLIDAQAHGLAVGAQWRLTPESALQLNAALNQLRVQNSPLIAGMQINQAQAGVGLVYGPFSGNVSGHVQRANGAGLPGASTGLWGGLDLGVSWRTPWRGELTVGARNLVTKGEDVLLPNPEAASIDRTSTRTPYVRYKQDL